MTRHHPAGAASRYSSRTRPRAQFNTSASSRSCMVGSTTGMRTVKGKVRDKDQGEREYPATLTVNASANTTPPTITCSASPNQLGPPNHQLVTVRVTVTANDTGGSGLAGVALVSVTSNEPDNGLGDGDTANDIQGWVAGTDDREGQLRAERAGGGSGRVY